MSARRNIKPEKLNQAEAKSYSHPEAESPLRPDVGTQSQFKKKKPPVTYSYDSSLSPALEWDGENSAREIGEWLISMIEKASVLPSPHSPHTFDTPQEFKNSSGQIVATVRGLHDAVEQLKRISKPFLNWTGKAERISFDVPTLPLFVHDRLSTKAIIETLKGHRKKSAQTDIFDLFGDPQRPVTESIFVQISDENVHHVRESMDEVFGTANFVSLISFSTTSGFASKTLSRAGDYIVWYSKDIEKVKYRQLYKAKIAGEEGATKYKPVKNIGSIPKKWWPEERLERLERLVSVDSLTSPYYQLKDDNRGPAGGFVYVRKQNNKGEEVGGIVPHVTLKSIANNEPPAEEVLVDRPETDNKITRVAGPFCIEATIPTPVDWEGDGVEDSGTGIAEDHGTFVDRMLEVLRKSPVLHIGGGKSVMLRNIRPPAKTLSLSAEAVITPPLNPLPQGEGRFDKQASGEGAKLIPSPLTGEGQGGGEQRRFSSEKSVALLFGPENGAVSEKLVHEALKEANLRGYSHLYVIGFAIQSNARILIENAVNMGMIPSTYVQATPDLMMGDLLKNMRSSQIFSVCGLPEVRITHLSPPSPPPSPAGEEGMAKYQVELLGIDIFDPITMETDHPPGNDVPAWFLDTDYNGLSFHVCQAFFPRTSAWDNLRRALKTTYEESVWEHLAGTKSIPFEAGQNGQIAVKVIDDRGNELMVVKDLKEVNK